MKKGIYLLTSLLIVGSMLVSACSSNNSSSNSASNNKPATSGNSTNTSVAPAGGLSEPFTATDLSKLPDIAKNRTDTIIVGLTDPSGALHLIFSKVVMTATFRCFSIRTLVSVDDKGLPVPGLAEKWDVSADNLLIPSSSQGFEIQRWFAFDRGRCCFYMDNPA